MPRVKCPLCLGHRKMIVDFIHYPDLPITANVSCSLCKGEGEVFKKPTNTKEGK